MTRRLPLALLAATALALTGCGAGVIGGVIAGSDSPSAPPPTVQVPRVTFPEQKIPLSPEVVGRLRDVIVENVSIGSVEGLSIEIRALGKIDEQLSPAIVSGSGNATGATQLKFGLSLAQILGQVPTLTAADVPAELLVLIDGVPVAPPAPITLVRQPVAILDSGSSVLSPAGLSRVTLRVSGLQSTDVLNDLDVLVGTVDEPVVRPCTDLALEAIANSEDVLISGTVPGNTYPGTAFLAVQGLRSGLSTPVEMVYAPQIDAIFAPAGPVEGGTFVTLLGLALVPLDTAASTPTQPALDFTRLTLVFRKGGRELELPPTERRDGDSTVNQLVFRVPAALDGRPGPVQVLVRVDLPGGEVVEASSVGLFTYGHQQIVYGPRGIALDDLPVAIAPGAFLDPVQGLDDVVVLTDQAGLGTLQIMGTLGNGMFRRVGAARLAVGAGDLAQRLPQDLCARDLEGDGLPDLLLLNRGTAQSGRHVVVRGQGGPAAALGTPYAASTTAGGMRDCLLGDFDGDGLQDAIMVPGPLAIDPRPLRLPGRSTAGSPGFGSGARLAVPSLRYDVAVLTDADGDGALDVVLAVGGDDPRLVLVRGDGLGGLGVQQELALLPQGYVPSAGVPVVGLHPLAGGDLAVVFAGALNDPATPPAVQRLQATGAGAGFAYQQVPSGTALFPAALPFVDSEAADLNRDGLEELVVASSGAGAPLRLLERAGSAFAERPGGVEPSAEQIRDVERIRWVRVFGGIGLAVVHSAEVDGHTERRISTYLASSAPLLRAPDSGLDVPAAIVDLVTGDFGDFSGDVLAVSLTALLPFRNDGFAGLQPQPGLEIEDLVPSSVRRIQLSRPGAGPGDGVVWLEDGAAGLRVGMFRPQDLALFKSADLRPLLPPHLERLPLDESPVDVADINGDGVEDLVVLWRFLGLTDPGEGDGALAVFLGKSAVANEEFPLTLPLSTAPTHGRASDLAFGDLAFGDLVQSGGAARLEAAVAVPESSVGDPLDGNHVRFYRFDNGGLVRSSAPGGGTALVAGTGPSRVAVADVDGNGSQDLVVASSDGRLRSFLTTGALSLDPLEVNIDDFFESSTSPQLLAPGVPTDLIRQDLNGDGLADFVVSVEDQVLGVRSASIGVYFTRGVGGLDGPRFLSESRTGNRVVGVLRNASASLAVADLNNDGLPDIVVGWESVGAFDRNLRVMLAQGR